MPLKHIEGKYEILAKLSEGGMGAIYKVRHRLLDEVRVVKVMRPHLAGDEGLSKRFQREARTAIQLRHRAIAELYDFALDPDGVAYIVMEFIEGHTLEHIIRASGPPPVGLSLQIGRQVLNALAFLHGKGFVHRDISPDNLMLTVDPQHELRVKIIDLGIAKTLADDRGLTATGTFLGKLRYAAPEQFSGAGAAGVDARSDLYSFGVVLYELLTGSFPIVGQDQQALVAGHLFHPPRPFEETDPAGTVAEELRQIVLDALAKNPSERIPDALTFSERLRALETRYPLDPTDAGRTLVGPASGAPGADDAGEVGSTQDRLDRQFAPGTTPAHPLTPVPATPVADAADGAPATGATAPDPSLERTRTLPEAARPGATEPLADAPAQAAPEAAPGTSSETPADGSPLRGWLDDQQAAQHAASARQQLDAGRPGEALAAARLALELRPEHAEARAVAEQAEQALARREALARAAEEVIGHLEEGALDDAERRLEAASEHLGEATVLRDLGTRIVAARKLRQTATPDRGHGARPRSDRPGAARTGAVGEAAVKRTVVALPPQADDRLRRMAALGRALWRIRRRAAAGLLAAGLAASVWAVWSMRATRRAEPVVVGLGTLVIDARPWAEIVAIENEHGEAIELPEHARFTPVALTLAPGPYALELRHPSAAEVHTVSARVAAGKVTPSPVPSTSAVDADRLLAELGF